MINVGLLVNLMTGHLLADFLFQKDAWVKDKRDRKLHGCGMWLHTIVVLIMTIAAFGRFSCAYIVLAVLITCAHVVIDYLKVAFTKNGPRAFAVDQILHVLVLLVMTCLVSKCGHWHQWGIIPEGKEVLYPVVICGYLFCISPANFIIREILKYCHVQERDNDNNEKATNNVKLSGMLIGSLERCLVLTFILIGSFEAAGLTVAAKSLLRFKDDERLRTEYVLIGTLLSILMAVICAVVIFKFGMNAAIIKMPK